MPTSVIRSRFALVIGFFLLLQVSGYALAQANFTADDCAVFKTPKDDSVKLAVVSKGERVEVSKKAYGLYKKVKFTIGKKQQIGYVKNCIFQLGIVPVKSRRQIYVALHYDRYMQGERGLQTADSLYEIGEFTGSAYFFSAGVSFPYRDAYFIRTSIVARRTKMAGTTQTDNSISTNEFSLEQNFIGANFFFGYSPEKWRGWATQFGLEYSHGQKVKLNVLSGPATNESEIEPPDFIITTLGLSRAVRISDSWQIEPALNLGAAVTANPPVVIIDGVFKILKNW